MSKGNYVLLDEEEIEAVKLESKRTLELLQFVDAGDIDILYYAKPYYVVPTDELAEEAYIVLREALKRTKKVGRSEEHTSELQSLLRISYAVFCLKKKKN